MSKSYSIDLRERVAGFIDKGQSRRAAARHFGVSESFAIKLDWSTPTGWSRANLSS
jgi:transposase